MRFPLPRIHNPNAPWTSYPENAIEFLGYDHDWPEVVWVGEIYSAQDVRTLYLCFSAQIGDMRVGGLACFKEQNDVSDFADAHKLGNARAVAVGWDKARSIAKERNQEAMHLLTGKGEVIDTIFLKGANDK